jgi:hypothetical protein
MKKITDSRIWRVAALLRRLHSDEFIAKHGTPHMLAKKLSKQNPEMFGRLVHFADELEVGPNFGPRFLAGRQPHSDGLDM